MNGAIILKSYVFFLKNVKGKNDGGIKKIYLRRVKAEIHLRRQTDHLGMFFPGHDFTVTHDSASLLSATFETIT